MRKREIRKLVLTRETVRNLTSEELALAGGAGPQVQRTLRPKSHIIVGPNTGEQVFSLGVACQYDTLDIC